MLTFHLHFIEKTSFEGFAKFRLGCACFVGEGNRICCSMGGVGDVFFAITGQFRTFFVVGMCVRERVTGGHVHVLLKVSFSF